MVSGDARIWELEQQVARQSKLIINLYKLLESYTEVPSDIKTELGVLKSMLRKSTNKS